jgi:hypothetical protein
MAQLAPQATQVLQDLLPIINHLLAILDIAEPLPLTVLDMAQLQSLTETALPTLALHHLHH